MVKRKGKEKLLPLIVLVLLSILVTGCSRSSNMSNGTKEVINNVDRELKVACGSVPNSGFNPYADAALYEIRACQQVYDYLVSLDEEGKVIPSLAENWVISDDGKTYTFNLRQGVMFSNGEEVKASDVVFSTEMAKVSSYNGARYINFDYAEALDKYTVVLHMKAPEFAFLDKLACGILMVVNETAYKEYGDRYGRSAETTVGSGPYIVTGFIPDEEVILVANEDYFKGVASVKKIKMKAISDKNAAVIALQAGDLDLYLEEISGVFIDTIKSDPSLSLSKFQSLQHVFVPMNNEKPPFNNLEVRKAIAYAIDRDKAVLVGTENQSFLVDFPGLPEFKSFPKVDKGWYSMDVEKAKQIIKDHGLEGTTITIKTYDLTPLPEVATSIQDDLSKIGLNVKIEKLEFNTFLQQTRMTGNYEICVTRLGCRTWDMDDYMHLLFHSSGVGIFNYSRYSNPRMDKILMDGKSEMNEEKREALYGEAVKIMIEDAIQVPLFFQTGFYAHTKDLTINQGLMNFGNGLYLYDYKWIE